MCPPLFAKFEMCQTLSRGPGEPQPAQRPPQRLKMERPPISKARQWASMGSLLMAGLSGFAVATGRDSGGRADGVLLHVRGRAVQTCNDCKFADRPNRRLIAGGTVGT